MYDIFGSKFPKPFTLVRMSNDSRGKFFSEGAGMWGTWLGAIIIIITYLDFALQMYVLTRV